MLKSRKNKTVLWKAAIDRFEDDKAVLIFAMGGQIVIGKDYLPAGAKEGDILKLQFGFDSEESDEKTKTAKNLLQKILRKQNDKLKREA